MELVDGRAQRGDLLHRVRARLPGKKAEVEGVVGEVEGGRREGLVPNDRRHLGRRADKGGDGVAEDALELRRDAILELAGLGAGRVEEHVPAGNEGLDVAEAEADEVLAQGV